MSELFTLPEAEPKPMPRKSDPERDSKKAKTKEAESSSKGSLSNASKEIQKALESLDEEAVTRAVKSYYASLEDEERKTKDKEKKRKKKSKNR